MQTATAAVVVEVEEGLSDRPPSLSTPQRLSHLPHPDAQERQGSGGAVLRIG